MKKFADVVIVIKQRHGVDLVGDDRFRGRTVWPVTDGGTAKTPVDLHRTFGQQSFQLTTRSRRRTRAKTNIEIIVEAGFELANTPFDCS